MTDTAPVRDLALGTYHYLNQREAWKPKGRPHLPIADMDPEWRHNAARWMERHAAYFATMYDFGELAWLTEPRVAGLDPEPGDELFLNLDLLAPLAVEAILHDEHARHIDPAGWIKGTALYQAVVAGVPIDDPALAARAKHYAGCAQREQSGADCDCLRLAAVVAHEAEIANGTPEWTDD